MNISDSIKIGTYYSKEKKTIYYCVIKKIEYNKVWGIWKNSKIDAIKSYQESPKFLRCTSGGRDKFLDLDAEKSYKEEKI